MKSKKILLAKGRPSGIEHRHLEEDLDLRERGIRRQRERHGDPPGVVGQVDPDRHGVREQQVARRHERLVGRSERSAQHRGRGGRRALQRFRRLTDRLEALDRTRATLGYHQTLKRGYAVVRGDGAVVFCSDVTCGMVGWEV